MVVIEGAMGFERQLADWIPRHNGVLGDHHAHDEVDLAHQSNLADSFGYKV